MTGHPFRGHSVSGVTARSQWVWPRFTFFIHEVSSFFQGKCFAISLALVPGGKGKCWCNERRDT